MRRVILSMFAVMLGIAASGQLDLVRYANSLQGTDSSFELSYGNTYPTVALPFGQHFWSAQTGVNGDGWKYCYADSLIRGFQQVHQCSPWMNDYAVFALFPETGTLTVDDSARGAAFRHSDETARPDGYKVRFLNGITTEFSATERCAHFRFTYPSKGKAYLVLDGNMGNSEVIIDASARRITGWVDNIKFLNAPGTFRCHFIVQFDKEIVSFGTWNNEDDTVAANNRNASGKQVGAYVEFRPGSKVQAKVTSSYISLEQAEVTLNRELGADRKVEQTRTRAFETWNALFNRVKIETPDEDRLRTFYSCLFRANLFSRQFFEIDADGNPYYYSPYDGKIHQGYMYTDNGFWDTFRSQFPLDNILHPTMQGRYMNALLDAYDQCGWLPQWSAPGETGGMLGNHAISLLADAWAKDIRTFDPERALKAYAHEAMNKGPWAGANGRSGWKEYFTLGYLPCDEYGGATASTLEYAYDDFCGYTLAKMVGNEHYMDVFYRQMFNWRNMFDPEVGFMRGKDRYGNWREPFDPYEWGDPFVEANAWHYTWSVFQDVRGLIEMFGGEDKFTARLDEVFSAPSTVNPGSYGGMIHEMTEMVLAGMGQYAHGNQPIQHMPYLYNYAGQPWKTQAHVREICGKLYNGTEKGFPGDEDQGGMSSWYVLSSLGIYSVCPGTDEYVIGSPSFDKAEIVLENGNTFTIVAENNSDDNVYIQSATLNGKPYDKNYIRYSDISAGGTLVFIMGPEPAKDRGVSPESRPFSLSEAK